MSKRLQLAILSQALLDALLKDSIEAHAYVSRHPALREKLAKTQPHERQVWARKIERALGR